jgi:hypothetical protein
VRTMEQPESLPNQAEPGLASVLNRWTVGSLVTSLAEPSSVFHDVNDCYRAGERRFTVSSHEA